MIARTIRSVPLPVLQAGVLALATSIATSSEARGQDTNISVALVGQALIKSDVCTTAPAAFEQARAYLKGVDVAFTNLEVAIAPAGRKLTPRGAAAVPAPPIVIDCLKSMGFNILSLANNHAFDLQRDGIQRHAAHAGDRHSPGARRGTAAGARHGGTARNAAGGGRCRAGDCRCLRIIARRGGAAARHRGR